MNAHPPAKPAENPSAASPALLRSADAAEQLAVSEATLSRWRTSGSGPRWINLNGIARYRQSDLDNFIEEHCA